MRLSSEIEIKGYPWKDERKKIGNELKLQRVQNPKLHPRILMKEELQLMGVL